MPVSKHNRSILCASVTAALLLVAGCGQGEQPGATDDAGVDRAASFEESLRLALETAKPGDIIDIPPGTHAFSRALVLNVDGVTIRGAGMSESVLSFAGQIAGAEGLLVNAGNFTIEDLAIEDTIGDALKINGGSNVIVRRVRTEWTRGPHTDNGAYGIYPVLTENTLIEGSVAIGASDAGIYVGQSRNVIVRNNRAEYNVAGIEVENTVYADVHDNVARHNTGGILVFNMPDLPQAGHSTRLFRNDVSDNNTPNFGAPGSAVASVPAGSGIIINSNDRVEIFENRIGNHKTANVLISSLFSAEYSSERETASSFDPYPETIYLYGNSYAPGGEAPDREALDQLRRALFGDGGRLPDIVWDGIVDAAKPREGREICIQEDEASFLDIDAANDSANPSTDLGPHDCRHEHLSAVTLAFDV
jgi:parallel beta-helix repeat protein